MDLSIIILNYKAKGLLKQCLKGIELVKPALDFEVIVVDNASGDGSIDMVKEQFPWVKLIENPYNTGYAAGNNVAIRQAQGKYVMILNPDITILNQSIMELYHFMEKNPKAGLIGPKLINPDGSTQMSCRRFPTIKTIIYRRTPLGKLPGAQKLLKRFLMIDWEHRDAKQVDWLLGACLFTKREAINKVGLLDERFFLYFEDVDWCRRFWQAGYKVYYLPQAEMVHYHRRLSAINPGFKGVFGYATRLHIVSGIKYFTKYFSSKDIIHD
ncbi:glycosyltransferase family 2 protein [Patescibacteria group bacterium]|nr:glycosyltransferase family 2 protein [Patescibacteria group bacterium]